MPETKPRVRCPQCRSGSIWKVGYVMTKKDGRKLRLKCQKCATTFYYKAPKAKKPKAG